MGHVSKQRAVSCHKTKFTIRKYICRERELHFGDLTNILLKKYCILIFFLNTGPYGENNFQTLLLHFSSEFSFQLYEGVITIMRM